MVWDRNKKLVKKSDRRYNMNPWALIWANDRYYLYGYDVKEKDGVLSERNYRVDKLDNIVTEQSQLIADQQRQLQLLYQKLETQTQGSQIQPFDLLSDKPPHY